MKGFAHFQLDLTKLDTECAAFEAVLQPGMRIELEEKAHLSPALSAARNVLALMAITYGGVANPDLWAKEFWVHDKLRCDFVFCNSRTRRYCFIEIEDARKESIFKEKRIEKTGTGELVPYFEWAPRFNHGTSQLLDWIRLFQDHHQTDDFQDHFGNHNDFHASFILIIGRAEFLSESRKRRLAWRSKNVITGGYKVQAFTFDDVLNEGKFQLSMENTEDPYAERIEVDTITHQAYRRVSKMLGVEPVRLWEIAESWTERNSDPIAPEELTKLIACPLLNRRQ